MVRVDSNGVTLTAPKALFGVVYTVEPAWVGSCRDFGVSGTATKGTEAMHGVGSYAENHDPHAGHGGVITGEDKLRAVWGFVY